MTSTYVKTGTVNFSDEMRFRHATVLKGVAGRVNLHQGAFMLKRADSSHTVILSGETEFIGITPAALEGTEVLVRGHIMTGGFYAESIAAHH